MDNYFEHLFDLINDPSMIFGHWFACKVMHEMEFTWLIKNDVNRAMDGLELRDEYGYFDTINLDGNPTMLEVVIGFCKRLQWEMQESVDDNSLARWFNEIMDNLGIEEGCNDEDYIYERVAAARDRRYDRNGNGGFFPVPGARKDQRKVEIWYQINDYLLAKYPIKFD